MRQPDALTLFLEFTPAMRALIEDAIESLILLLDEIDGDADMEETWDREFDPAEHGIGDMDGQQEQWGGVVNGEWIE